MSTLKLEVGAMVKVLDGKHKGRYGVAYCKCHDGFLGVAFADSVEAIQTYNLEVVRPSMLPPEGYEPVPYDEIPSAYTGDWSGLVSVYPDGGLIHASVVAEVAGKASYRAAFAASGNVYRPIKAKNLSRHSLTRSRS